MAKRYSLIERQQHLDAWQHSGLTQKGYCRQNNISLSAFYYWMKHSKDNAGATLTPAFIPARRVTVDNTHVQTVTLNLPNGCSVSCFPTQWVGVMQALSLC